MPLLAVKQTPASVEVEFQKTTYVFNFKEGKYHFTYKGVEKTLNDKAEVLHWVDSFIVEEKYPHLQVAQAGKCFQVNAGEVPIGIVQKKLMQEGAGTKHYSYPTVYLGDNMIKLSVNGLAFNYLCEAIQALDFHYYSDNPDLVKNPPEKAREASDGSTASYYEVRQGCDNIDNLCRWMANKKGHTEYAIAIFRLLYLYGEYDYRLDLTLPEIHSELQHLISYKNMNAQIGECFRAMYRLGQSAHSDPLRDLKKTKYYLEAELERLANLDKDVVVMTHDCNTLLKFVEEGLKIETP